jgi:hypothetical protein
MFKRLNAKAPIRSPSVVAATEPALASLGLWGQAVNPL